MRDAYAVCVCRMCVSFVRTYMCAVRVCLMCMPYINAVYEQHRCGQPAFGAPVSCFMCMP